METAEAVDAILDGIVDDKLAKDVRSQLHQRAVRRLADQIERADRLRTAKGGRAMDGADFIFGEMAQSVAIWGDGDDILWGRGEGLMIASDQGLGKTTIAQQVILHMIGVREGPFLGRTVAPLVEGRILYLAMDRPRQAARSLLRMVRPEHLQTIKDRLAVWRGPLPFDPLASPTAFMDWMLEEFGSDIQVVVFDSVKDIAPGIAKDEVGAGINSMWQELIANDIQVLLLHHERKADNTTSRSSRRPALDHIYGSTWLTSGLGSVLALQGERGAEVVELLHLKSVASQQPDTSIRHDFTFGVTTLSEQTAREVAVSAMQQVRSALMQHALHGITQAELEVASGVSKGTVSKKVAELRSEARVEKRDGRLYWVGGEPR